MFFEWGPMLFKAARILEQWGAAAYFGWKETSSLAASASHHVRRYQKGDIFLLLTTACAMSGLTIFEEESATKQPRFAIALIKSLNMDQTQLFEYWEFMVSADSADCADVIPRNWFLLGHGRVALRCSTRQKDHTVYTLYDTPILRQVLRSNQTLSAREDYYIRMGRQVFRLQLPPLRPRY